jgi:hypothetical protein
MLYVNLAVLGRWYRQGQIHEAIIRRRRLQRDLR